MLPFSQVSVGICCKHVNPAVMQKIVKLSSKSPSPFLVQGTANEFEFLMLKCWINPLQERLPIEKDILSGFVLFSFPCRPPVNRILFSISWCQPDEQVTLLCHAWHVCGAGFRDSRVQQRVKIGKKIYNKYVWSHVKQYNIFDHFFLMSGAR